MGVGDEVSSETGRPIEGGNARVEYASSLAEQQKNADIRA